LGSLIIDFPQLKYFFGKFTMYPAYNRYARDVLHTFLHRFFPDKEELVKAKKPIPWKYDFKELAKLFDAEKYEENYKILVRTLRKNGENIPPLVNAYMNLSETMRVFGTSLNPTFGNVEETGILITIGDIHNHKTERHVSSYK
jgi:hypothetical protein